MTLLADHRALARGYDLTLVAPHAGVAAHGQAAALAAGRLDPRPDRYKPPDSVRWHRCRAVGCQPLHRRLWLADGQRLDYDLLSLNTGTRRLPDWCGVSPAGAPAVWSAHSAADMRRFTETLSRRACAARLVIVGGARASLGWARAAIARAGQPAGSVVLLWPARQPASRDVVRAQSRLARSGVEIVRGAVPSALWPGMVMTEDGRRFAADHVIWAAAEAPSSLALASGLATTPAGVSVNAHLLSSRGVSDRLFALGGLASLTSRRALPGWDSAEQARVLQYNLQAQEQREGLIRYRPPRRAPTLDFRLDSDTRESWWTRWTQRGVRRRFEEAAAVFEPARDVSSRDEPPTP